MYRVIFSAILAIFVWAQLAPAQLTTGTISGTIKDESGAVVPGVAVTVKNVDTGVSREVSTDAQGHYRAPNLALGNYEVQAGVSGFQTAVRTGITLRVGQEAAIDFTLKVGEVSAKIEVTGEAPLVEATRSDVSGVIEQSQVSDLPLNGRSYLQLALLQPGVVATRNTSNLSFGGPQTVLATAGSQSTAGLYLLDGTDISDYLFATSPGGASGMAIGVDMIREFRVLTNSFSAEYGRTTGGVLTVVSKGGTNQLNGTAFWFHRNDNMDARNFFAGRKPEFKRNQWGATIGGPIVRDKTFFLGSYESLREGLGVASVAIVPNLQARQGILPASMGGNVGVAPGVKPFLDLYPLPNGQDFGNGTAQWQGSLNQPTREDFFSGRVDHVFSEKDTLFGRYTFRDGYTSVPFGSTAVPGYPGVGENRTQFTSLEETHVFTPTVLNTLRLSFNRNARSNPVDPVPQQVSISLLTPNRGMGPIYFGDLTPLGNRASRPAFGPINVFQVQDAVDFTRGRHSVKAGTDILRFQVSYDYLYLFNGQYIVPSLSSLLAGRGSSYSGVLPGSDAYRAWRWTAFAFFVQDEFRVLPNLTLNLGLRYEPYTNPTEAQGKLAVLADLLKDTAFTKVDSIFETNPSLKNFQPRFGFAWDPWKNGKLAIRGGFGIYYDRFFANQEQSNTNPPFATTIQVGGPTFPNPLAGGNVATLVSPQSTLTYRGFSYPYSMQWNFSLQQEIVPSTVVSATYAGSRGVHVVIQGNGNLNQWEFRDGRKFFPVGARRLNPAFGESSDRMSKGSAFFHSLGLSLRRRLSQGFQLQVAYTWSKAIDDGSTFGAAPVGNSPFNIPDLYDPKLSRGLADVDVRHNFVFSSSYELPFASESRWLGGWQLGGIVSLASGIPFTQTMSFDRARSGTARTPDGPNRVKPVTVEPRNADRYFDLTAFQLQEAGYFGNTGRNSLVGPGLVNVDFSVIKTIPITEKVKVQWRAELFNIFNRANFGTPGDSGAGTGGGTFIFADASGVPVPTAAKIRKTVTSARQIQMGLKISF